MFNLKSGISIFEQIMLVFFKSNKPGPNIAGPTHLKLVVKGFLQTSPQFHPHRAAQFAALLRDPADP